MKLARKSMICLSSLFISLSVVTSCSRIENSTLIPEGYDYIVGSDYSDLVKITFKYGNIEGKIGDTYKIWGVPRNHKLGYTEPKYPDHLYIEAIYGLSSDFIATNRISLNSYLFTKDTTLFVKYYETMQEIRFCIPNGPTNEGSGMMFSYKAIFGNTEIYKLPTLDEQIIDTDWGEFDITKKAYFDPYVTQWGWSKIDGWYYDEELTKPINTPFRLTHHGDQLKFWMKCS